MKKKLIDHITTLLLLAIICIIAIYFINVFRPKDIEGIIILVDNQTFSIITNNDSIYSFNKNNKYNYEIDSIVKIKYNKNIDDRKNIQNINILKINKISNLKFNKDDLFYNYYDKAINTIDIMNLEEKVGQLLLARVPLTNQIDTIKEYNLGGYLLFERDIKNKTKEEIINTNSSYQAVSSIPLLIAIDEEGGIVSRLSNNSAITESPFLSSQELFKKGSIDEIIKDTITKSDLLYSLGINVNLAPVADVTTSKKSYMYSRSFGKNAEETSIYIENVIKNTDEKVSYVLKHFPGYGDNGNTHSNISIDKRNYNNFLKKDFKPFQAGINNNVQAILFSHNYVNCMDSINPSSLSANVHNILKNTLKYSGISITDDLEMNSVKNINNKYTKALLAGNNLIIVTDYKDAYNEIINNIKSNYISEELINRLLIKTIAWKYYKGLL